MLHLTEKSPQETEQDEISEKAQEILLRIWGASQLRSLTPADLNFINYHKKCGEDEVKTLIRVAEWMDDYLDKGVTIGRLKEWLLEEKSHQWFVQERARDLLDEFLTYKKISGDDIKWIQSKFENTHPYWDNLVHLTGWAGKCSPNQEHENVRILKTLLQQRWWGRQSDTKHVAAKSQSEKLLEKAIAAMKAAIAESKK